ncbi:MAG: zinc finger domain-containing protein [Candidatus Acidiferrales bacterium]
MHERVQEEGLGQLQRGLANKQRTDRRVSGKSPAVRQENVGPARSLRLSPPDDRRTEPRPGGRKQEMRTKQPTLRQQSSVACPTCGVAAGKRCVLAAGGPRNGPHRNRKVAAAEAVEKKKTKKR